MNDEEMVLVSWQKKNCDKSPHFFSSDVASDLSQYPNYTFSDSSKFECYQQLQHKHQLICDDKTREFRGISLSNMSVDAKCTCFLPQLEPYPIRLANACPAWLCQLGPRWANIG